MKSDTRQEIPINVFFLFFWRSCRSKWISFFPVSFLQNPINICANPSSVDQRLPKSHSQWQNLCHTSPSPSGINPISPWKIRPIAAVILPFMANILNCYRSFNRVSSNSWRTTLQRFTKVMDPRKNMEQLLARNYRWMVSQYISFQVWLQETHCNHCEGGSIHIWWICYWVLRR